MFLISVLILFFFLSCFLFCLSDLDFSARDLCSWWKWNWQMLFYQQESHLILCLLFSLNNLPSNSANCVWTPGYVYISDWCILLMNQKHIVEFWNLSPQRSSLKDFWHRFPQPYLGYILCFCKIFMSFHCSYERQLDFCSKDSSFLDSIYFLLFQQTYFSFLFVLGLLRK